MEEEKLNEKANDFFNSKNYLDCLEILEDLINLCNYNSEYHNFKGNCLYNLKRYKESIESFDKAISLNKKNLPYLRNKAGSLIELGELTEAYRILDDLIKSNNKNYLSFFLKAKALFKENKFYQSIEYLNKSLLINEEHSYSHYWLGKSLRELLCIEESIKAFDTAIFLNTEEPDFYKDKALSLIAIKRFEEALIQLEKAVNINFENKEHHFYKALCFFNLEKYEEALISVDEALDIDPIYANGWGLKAKILLKMGKFKQALFKVNNALELDNENYKFYETKGLILFELKEEAKAIDCLIRALRNKDDILGNNNKYENPAKLEVLDALEEIVCRYKRKCEHLDSNFFQKELDECLKSLSDITTYKPINQDIPEFIIKNIPIELKNIHIDQNHIINYQQCMEEYFCKICFSLLKEPKCCNKCEDLFCAECLNETLNKGDRCPLCREAPFKESKVNKTVRNTLNGIEFLCPLDCKEKLGMEIIAKHFSEVCQKCEKYLVCKICDCRLNKIEDSKEHANTCPEVFVKCAFCENCFKNKEIEDHLNMCGERLVNCEECLCLTRLKQFEDHKVYFCGVLRRLKNKLEALMLKFL